MKILMFSTLSMKYIWYSPKKSKYPLFHFKRQTQNIQVVLVSARHNLVKSKRKIVSKVCHLCKAFGVVCRQFKQFQYIHFFTSENRRQHYLFFITCKQTIFQLKNGIITYIYIHAQQNVTSKQRRLDVDVTS